MTLTIVNNLLTCLNDDVCLKIGTEKRKKKEHDFAVNAFGVVQEATGEIKDTETSSLNHVRALLIRT